MTRLAPAPTTPNSAPATPRPAPTTEVSSYAQAFKGPISNATSQENYVAGRQLNLQMQLLGGHQGLVIQAT